ncbi:hypothetical protein SAMN05216296_2091 [Pseudomonas pohangensis]|uniref:Uncharacterized protein n=1 Tax=Pseudomonas pohangensis TaxID=364197 RepID=A0A1H2G7A0_9PSED|nr:HEPN domain-containing protein [Pseudomonas pohangensis]SDU15434.1 hypothetical protein SAMN05216296_2091 [Pseudomonas pohangensis]
MRLKEEYKKSGYFWLPGNEDKKIPGTLTISDGGDIELEVVGLFDESIKGLNGEDDLNRIIGHVEKDGFVTLDNCFYKKKNYAFFGIAKSLIHVNQALSGVAYEQDEKVTFHTVSFSIEGLNEWVGISGISVAYGDDYRTATINYTPQDEIIYNLINEFKLHIFFGYTLPGLPATTEAKITHKTYLKLSSEKARELPEFIYALHQITYLLCFAVDATVAISDVSATSNEIVMQITENKSRPVNIKIFYPSLPFPKEHPKIDFHRMLFRFAHIRENAEEIFNNWLNAYSVISPAIGLYFSAVSGSHKYLDGKFLALAQGLETYHRRTSSETLMDRSEFRSMMAKLLWMCPKENRRWLRGRLRYGNEINLGQRIKKIIEPYKSYIGNGKQRSKIIRGVVNTRNYLTHYSEELKDESVKGANLWVLCQKMEAIFQLHLLQQLGFTVSEIQEILASNYKLQQKFSEI